MTDEQPKCAKWFTPHRYGKWVDVKRFDLVDTLEREKVGECVMQRRRCEYCGRLDQRFAKCAV